VDLAAATSQILRRRGVEVEQNCDSWLCFGFGSFSSKNTNLNDFFCDRFPY
jgi:hypothetical protein